VTTTDPNPFASPTQLEPTSTGQRWVSVDSPELRRTGLGLSFVYFGIVLVLLSVILSFFVITIGNAAYGVILQGGVLVGYLLMLIGPMLCLSVPAETGAKGYIVGSVILQLLNICLTLGSAALGAGSAIPSWVGLGGGATAMFGSILFVLFMRQLALFIGRDDLAKHANIVLILGLVLIASAIGAAVAATFLPSGIMLVIVVAIVGLALFLKYANLINALRKALRKRSALGSASGRL
jgi:hypothetical protein